MEFPNITFVPMNNNMNSDEEDNTQIISHALYSQIPALLRLQNLSNLSTTPRQQSLFSLDNFKHNKIVNPSIENIKDFSDSFKEIKIKLTNINELIVGLEKRKEIIKITYEDVNKKIVEFFGLTNSHEFASILAMRSVEMINNLELDKHYEERKALLEYYEVAIPLLKQVEQEFFAEKSKIGNCPICYEKDISFTILNCGHCICEECKKKVVSSCFLCRGPVTKISRIYIT
jgi:hypothetical protein